MAIENESLRNVIRESVGFGASIALVGLMGVSETCSYVLAQSRRLGYAMRGVPTRLLRTSTPEGLSNVGYEVEEVQRN